MSKGPRDYAVEYGVMMHAWDTDIEWCEAWVDRGCAHEQTMIDTSSKLHHDSFQLKFRNCRFPDVVWLNMPLPSYELWLRRAQFLGMAA